MVLFPQFSAHTARNTVFSFTHTGLNKQSRGVSCIFIAELNLNGYGGTHGMPKRTETAEDTSHRYSDRGLPQSSLLAGRMPRNSLTN